MIRTKKSLGQHFLRDINYAQRIATAVQGESGCVVEIGPGQGMLTQFLTGRFSELLLIEKDDVLAASIQERYRDDPNIQIRGADVLNFDLRGYWSSRPFSLVGNYPYNISSQIVFRMLELRTEIPEMVGMFQYEMAKRIVSGPGTKDYGILSVLTCAYYHRRMLFKVPPGAFYPPPKVESAVIRLEAKPSMILSCSFESLLTVVKLAFGQRRKMLRNSLKSLINETRLGSDSFFTRRPEQVSVDEFIHLATEYELQHKS